MKQMVERENIVVSERQSSSSLLVEVDWSKMIELLQKTVSDAEFLKRLYQRKSDAVESSQIIQLKKDLEESIRLGKTLNDFGSHILNIS